MKITRLIGHFQAKADNGQLFTIDEFQEYISVLSSTGTITESQGLKRWKTSTGSPVNQIDSNTYQIIASNEIIKKV